MICCLLAFRILVNANEMIYSAYGSGIIAGYNTHVGILVEVKEKSFPFIHNLYPICDHGPMYKSPPYHIEGNAMYVLAFCIF